MDEFMWKAGNTLAEMRLVAEGAIQLYASLNPLYQKAVEEGRLEDAVSLDTLEGALNTLKDHITELQTAHQEGDVGTAVKQGACGLSSPQASHKRKPRFVFSRNL